MLAVTGPVAAVLLAGSDEQTVFDHGRRALARELQHLHPHDLSLAMLSGDPAAGDAGPATLAGIEQAFARTTKGAGSCLFFATSHGSRQGIVLTFDRELLTPEALAALLARYCAGKPTVLILSACFSGIFADPPLPAANRIILTAAARDRTSFGCSNDLAYTYYDEALLDLLPTATGWRALHAALKTVIATRERGMAERPSRPQASFGAAMPDGALLAH